MTVKECYEAMGANYDDVAGRLRKDERIRKFLLKLPDDKSYDLLLKSLDERNMEEAFRAAHTIKGTCLNLSLTTLYRSASQLSDRLRDRREYDVDIEPLLEQLKKDYTHMLTCIAALL